MRTSSPDFSPGTLNAYLVRPSEVKHGDRFGYKIIAIVDEQCWSAYRGPTGWSDDQVARHGDSISRAVAEAIFPSMAHLHYSE